MSSTCTGVPCQKIHQADSEGSGKGSTFTFTLPDISDKEELLEMEAQAPKKESLKPLARSTKAAEDI